MSTDAPAWRRTIVPIMGVLLPLIAIVLLYRQTIYQPPPAQAALVWAYDLGAGKLIKVPGDQLPPFDAPSGKSPDGSPTGVWAAVFACGSCDNEPDRYIGWLEMLSPTALQRLAPLYKTHDRPDSLDDVPFLQAEPEHRLIASKDKPGTWLTYESPEAVELRREARENCPAGKTAVVCGASPG